jgi:hypothetical protein
MEIELESERDLFLDADSLLLDLELDNDRERSVVREAVPPLPVRSSPARPKPNRFMNEARAIVALWRKMRNNLAMTATVSAKNTKLRLRQSVSMRTGRRACGGRKVES